MWPFRSKQPTLSRQLPNSATVGLDHAPVRGVGPRSETVRRLVFLHDVAQYHVASWRIWREYMRDTYKLGVSRHRVIEAAKPRDAFFQFRDDSDYRAVRSMMADAGMYVTPFDTITPEEITNGE